MILVGILTCPVQRGVLEVKGCHACRVVCHLVWSVNV